MPRSEPFDGRARITCRLLSSDDWRVLDQVILVSLACCKGQVVLPASVRKALGLRPGMLVNIPVEGKGARITPAPVTQAVSLKDIQTLLKFAGTKVPIEEMRVTGYAD